MKVVSLSDKVLKVLEDFAPGADLGAKLEYLTRESLEHNLRACNEALSRFEAKYGQTFTDFVQAWQEGRIPQQYSHEVERDFMEWEARHQEKEDLLAAVREFDQPEPRA
jgi:hypothetical protein